MTISKNQIAKLKLEVVTDTGKRIQGTIEIDLRVLNEEVATDPDLSKFYLKQLLTSTEQVAANAR